MANFIPQQQRSSDPSYIGYSRQTSGDRSSAALVRGLGSLFLGGVQLADESIKANIKEDLNAGVLDVNESILPEDATIDEESTDDTTTIDIFQETKTQATGPGVQGSQAKAQASKLTRAFRAGRITPAYYWGQMSKLSRELKTRYPGYESNIDRQFQGITGQIPANALANARRKEYTSHLSKVNEEEKHFQSLIRQQWVQEYLPVDYWERQSAGDPYTKLEVYKFINDGRRVEAELSSEKARLSLAKERGNLVQEEALGAAINRVNTISGTVLNSTFGQGIVRNIQDAVRRQGRGIQMSPEEKNTLRTQFAQLRAQIRQKQIAALNAPDQLGNTYNSLISDPSKTKTILEQGQQELNVLENLLNDEDFGLFAATLNHIKARREDYTNQVLSVPFFGYAEGIKEVAGTEIFDQLSMNTSFQKQMHEANQTLMDIVAAKTITGDTSSLESEIEKTVSAAKGGNEQKAILTRGLIEQSVTALSSPSTVEQARVTAAEKMFGQGNQNFLLRFSGNSRQMNAVYRTMISAQVTATMSAVAETRSDLWNKYVNWAKGSFMAMQHGNISGVVEGLTEREDTNISWDGDNKRFVFSLTERGRQRRKASEDNLVNLENYFNTNIERAVDSLNDQISLLSAIIELDGGNVEEELSVLLGSSGVMMPNKKEATFFASLRDKLSEYVKEKGGEKNSP